jgi:hypothetical protein
MNLCHPVLFDIAARQKQKAEPAFVALRRGKRRNVEDMAAGPGESG